MNHEVLAVNNEPYNIFFVEPLSELAVSSGGLELPKSSKFITQTGIVAKCFNNDFCKSGDTVEYRRNSNYPVVNIDNVSYQVLKGADIYRINGIVSPFRMIMSIDIRARRNKTINSDS
jgi:co-chaperonin GroES (HSP10)